MRTILFITIFSSILISCNQKGGRMPEENLYTFNSISDTSNEAVSPLTGLDMNGNPYIYWVEKESTSDKNIVAFALSDNSSRQFGKRIYIPPTSGCNDGHGQGMPRIAFKKDGTMIVVYHVRTPTDTNPYAGKVLYIMSSDQGKSWSAPTPVHSDTSANNSHGFPAITSLADGEVAAVWLDGRNKLPHSELYLAKTSKGKGFEKENKIGGPACQCCKLDLYMDQQHQLHVLYRGIGDSSIRDIMHIYSTDGITFNEPEKISNDGWKLKGCPHAGPGILQLKDTLHYVWFTMGSGKGIFHAKSGLNGKLYSDRRTIAENEFAKYPQLSQLINGDLAIVWQEYIKGDSTGYNKIKMEQLSNEGIKRYSLTNEIEDASHPVITRLADKDMLVFEKEINGKSVVGYREIKLK